MMSFASDSLFAERMNWYSNDRAMASFFDVKPDISGECPLPAPAHQRQFQQFLASLCVEPSRDADVRLLFG
jgi:hypothetical protein